MKTMTEKKMGFFGQKIKESSVYRFLINVDRIGFLWKESAILLQNEFKAKNPEIQFILERS